MAGYNSITVTGIATNDAEARQVKEGLWAVKVRLVTGNRDKPAEQVWFTLCKWLREPSQRQLEYYSNIKKGSPLTATGPIKLSTYTGKDGLPAASIEVSVNDMIAYNSTPPAAAGQAQAPARQLSTPKIAVDEGYDPFAGG